MKKKLSLSEFKDIYDALPAHCIIYSSSNQAQDANNTMANFQLRFNKMIITFNPNTLYLQNGDSSLQLNQVRTVQPHNDCLLGRIFTFICGDSTHDGHTREYTLIIT